ncbi:MAG: hypothetical protein Q7T03_08870 [Deltaproteobacteria bacterium]|nr:hypothetical protein [Deltaproteobacteria bacterium]
MLKKYPYVYEIPLLYLLLYAINRILIPEYIGFVGIDPHPYWIGILLFGFRYGIIAGIATGLISAILYLSLSWFYIERYLFEDISFYMLPGFFILVGVLIGVGVERNRRILATQEVEKEIFLKNEKALKEEIKTLGEINQGLEKRIVTRMATLVTLYEGARRMETVQVEQLYRSILEFVAKTLDAGEAAVYLKTPEGWQLKEKYGWKDYEKRPEKFKPDEGITGMAGASGKVVSVRDFIHQGKEGPIAPELLGDCLVAGPLRKGEQGEVLAVLSIQNIPFLNFNSATINLFGFLLQWASRALERAFFVQELRAQEIIDPEYQVYSWPYFLGRGSQEFVRSQTYYLPLSVGLFCVEGEAALVASKRVEIFTTVAELLKACCREMDVIAKSPEEGIPFAVLWMTASKAQAGEIRSKIQTHFEKLKLPVKLQIGVASFSPQSKDFDNMLQEAREDLHHD